MKIVLTHGRTFDKIICNSCNCCFLFQRSDIKDKDKRIDFYNSDVLYTYVECPECKNHIIINDYRKSNEDDEEDNGRPQL